MYTPSGLGWQHDPPDNRDDSPHSKIIQEMLELAPTGDDFPEQVDLREFFLGTQNQQSLHASCAHACTELFQYFERRCEGRLVPLSRLFLYKCARTLLKQHGNAPVDLRTTLKALATFGCPPEDLWPYDVENFDLEPSPITYSFTRRFSSLRYVRLDRPNQTGRDSLVTVKAFLAAGFPVAFGFMVPHSISRDGEIPYRPTFDSYQGGQAVLAVGYDDNWLRSTRGALLIRNSWGSEWGEDGYAWLPYSFVENQLAVAFWTLIRPDWMQSGEFCQPRLNQLAAPLAH